MNFQPEKKNDSQKAKKRAGKAYLDGEENKKKIAPQGMYGLRVP